MHAKAPLSCRQTNGGYCPAALPGNFLLDIVLVGGSKLLLTFQAGWFCSIGMNWTGISSPLLYIPETPSVLFGCRASRLLLCIPSLREMLALYLLLLTPRNISGSPLFYPTLFIFSSQLFFISCCSLTLTSKGAHQSLVSPFYVPMKNTGNQLFCLSRTVQVVALAGLQIWITVPLSELLLTTQAGSGLSNSSKFLSALQHTVAAYSPASSCSTCWTGLYTIIHSLRSAVLPASIVLFWISYSSIFAIVVKEDWSDLYWVQSHWSDNWKQYICNILLTIDSLEPIIPVRYNPLVLILPGVLGCLILSLKASKVYPSTTINLSLSSSCSTLSQ